jgi:hypothetical protein
MATNYWLGVQKFTAQVGTVAITAYDTGTTYTLTVGAKSVSVVGSGGSTSTVATALTAAWNARADAEFSGITATSSGATITLTADTAGVPFVVTAGATGGTGSIGSYTATTANQSPSDWNDPVNWSLAAVPVSTDDVVIEGARPSILWNLDQNAVLLASLTIRASFTGKIGLHSTQLTTSADGETLATTGKEYRAIALKLGATLVEIAAGSGGRVVLDLDTDASTVRVLSVASSADAGKPGLRLVATNASNQVHILSAAGGVGIAFEPGQTSTVSQVTVGSQAGSGAVYLGAGLTLTTLAQSGGAVELRCACTTATVEGGTLITAGVFLLGTLNVRAGQVYPNHSNGGSACVTTATLSGGTVDATRSRQARTWSTVNFSKGASLKADAGVLTITTPVLPSSSAYTLAVAA